MTRVIGVKFKENGKVYYFDPKNISAKEDQYVIVETVRGVECGKVASAPHDVNDEEIVQPLKEITRIATEKDIKQEKENQEKEKEAFKICEEKIIAREMEMKLIDVEYVFDRSKIIFYFTADGRMDFRELVKDLASIFKTRIELRQIGVRDEAKMLGGLGICGREFCCSSFLGDFQPVSIKMAKEQGLSLNPTKMSGTCGRLMCCLKYEQDAYEDLIKNTPKVNSVVKTPDGEGTVAEVSLLTGYVKVKTNDDSEALKIYHKNELDNGAYIEKNVEEVTLEDDFYELLNSPVLEKKKQSIEEPKKETDNKEDQSQNQKKFFYKKKKFYHNNDKKHFNSSNNGNVNN